MWQAWPVRQVPLASVAGIADMAEMVAMPGHGRVRQARQGTAEMVEGHGRVRQARQGTARMAELRGCLLQLLRQGDGAADSPTPTRHQSGLTVESSGGGHGGAEDRRIVGIRPNLSQAGMGSTALPSKSWNCFS